VDMAFNVSGLLIDASSVKLFTLIASSSESVSSTIVDYSVYIQAPESIGIHISCREQP